MPTRRQSTSPPATSAGVVSYGPRQTGEGLALIINHNWTVCHSEYIRIAQIFVVFCYGCDILSCVPELMPRRCQVKEVKMVDCGCLSIPISGSFSRWVRQRGVTGVGITETSN